MASFSKGTSFTDGVTGDVTAAKLHALVDAATPVAGLVTDRTAKTSVVGADLVLLSDSADSNALKKMTVTNLFKTDVSITSGTGTAGTVAIGPTGDTNTGLFFPAADTIAFSEGGTEAMRIASSGNIGIGSTAPDEKLTVEGGIQIRSTNKLHFTSTINQATIHAPLSNTIAITTDATERLRIDSSGNVGIGNTVASTIISAAGGSNGSLVVGSGSGTPNIILYGGASNYGSLYFADGTTGGDTFRGYVEYNHTDNFLRLGTNTNERLRIDSSGRVLIGTSSASGGIAAGGLEVTDRIAVGGGSVGTPSFHFVGDSDTGVYQAGANGVGLVTGGTERLRIDSSGNVGIGTTSPSAQLELSTDSAKKPSTNTWTIASDVRLKTNITEADTDRCLEIVRQIPLKRYTWRDDVYSQEAVRDRSKLGWIAQDVESVFPKAVGTKRFTYNQVFEDVVTPELDADGNPVLDEDGNAKTRTERRLVSEDVIEDCKDLNSDQIYAVMYGAIQKLASENDSLKSRVAALEAA